MSSPAAAGNPRAGAQIFRTKGGCLGCHALGNEGGRVGPPLTGIGARRGAAHLKAKIEDPASDVPDQFRLVQLTTKAGKSVRGIRLNEDTYSIQIRDFNGNPQSFWKADIAKLSQLPAYTTNAGDGDYSIGPDYAPPLSGRYFNMRKTTIYGGSTEVQKNIVSKAILGL